MGKGALLGFDLRALQAGFKAHKTRGIGIYTRSLVQRLSLAPDGFAMQAFHDANFEAVEPEAFGSVQYETSPANALRPFVKEYLCGN